MKCSKSGFTPFRIAALVVGGIALVTHITAVAYPEWDGVDTKWYTAPGTSRNLTIKSKGSLWKLTIEKDETGRFFAATRSQIDTAWKKPIILMATTGIVAGGLGEGFLVLTAMLQNYGRTKRVILPMCSEMASFVLNLCAAFESLMGAILYMFNFEKQHRPIQCNAADLPVDELALRAGFYIECAAGGLFLLTLFLNVLDILNYERSEITPVRPLVQEGADKP